MRARVFAMALMAAAVGWGQDLAPKCPGLAGRGGVTSAKQARYNGSGSVEDAGSFSCR
jgi:hypothetical protein